MAKKLTNQSKNNQNQGSRLVKTEVKFKLCIQEKLQSKYCFSSLRKSQKALAELDNFIEDTTHKCLTISEVDKLYLRTNGPIKSSEDIHGTKRDIVHYGKNRKPFRIHGYYNDDGYFVVCKIDPDHNVHR